MSGVQRPAARKSGGPPRAKAVLLGVIGLHLVAETALTPFLPRLFERLYGIEDPGATGLYIWICRIVGLAVLPLWGLAARRWPLHRLVLAGLCGSAVFDLLLGLSPSYAAYTVLSTAVVATNSAMLLAYPAFIAEHGDDPGDGERSRLAGICAIVVVFHLSVVVATLVGAGVLALPQPRIGISAFAVLDAGLAVLTYRILGTRARQTDQATATPPEADPAPTAPAKAPARTGPGAVWLLVLAQAALIGLTFDFAVNVARPFFTEFAESLGSGSAGAAALFFLPSVAALAVLPAVRRCHTRLGDRLLPAAMLVGAAGYVWQAFTDDLPGLVGGRLLFGVGLGVGQVAVELRMFRATGTAGPAFTAVETTRAAGLLAAPLVATAAVSRDLALPLLVAAVVQVLGVLLSVRGGRAASPRAETASPAGPRHVLRTETAPAPGRPAAPPAESAVPAGPQPTLHTATASASGGAALRPTEPDRAASRATSQAEGPFSSADAQGRGGERHNAPSTPLDPDAWGPADAAPGVVTPRPASTSSAAPAHAYSEENRR